MEDVSQDQPERRILRTVPSYHPYVTGPANQAKEISRRLLPYRYRSCVVTTNLGVPAAPRYETHDGVDVHRFAIKLGIMQYHVAPQALQYIRAQPAELVHVHCFRNFLADTAALAARARRVPLVLQLHGTLAAYRRFVSPGRQWMYVAYDRLFRLLPTLRADRIVVSTRAEAREAEEYGLDRDHICVIPMGIEPQEYVFPDIQRASTEITFVGRLAEDRNVEQLLQALGLISDLEWSCTIVGGEERRSYSSPTGYLDRLKHLASNIGILDRVHFAGPLYGAALRQMYARAGIFVYPSRYENFGQTMLEAAAGGCSLVTTPVGVAHELVQAGLTGFQCPVDAPQMLARHIRWLLEHPAEQRVMGARAQQLAQREYTWESILRQYVALYEQLLGQPEPGSGA